MSSEPYVVEWALKAIHIIESLPDGDIVEIETMGGYVMRVDPTTHQSTNERQRFKLQNDKVTLLVISKPAIFKGPSLPERWAPPVHRSRHER